jgi:hypothetical protein
MIRVEHDLEGQVVRTRDLGSADEIVGSSSASLRSGRYLVQRTTGLAVVEDGGAVVEELSMRVDASVDCRVGGEATFITSDAWPHAYWILDVDCEGATELTLSIADESLTVPRPRASVLVEIALP